MLSSIKVSSLVVETVKLKIPLVLSDLVLFRITAYLFLFSAHDPLQGEAFLQGTLLISGLIK